MGGDFLYSGLAHSPITAYPTAQRCPTDLAAPWYYLVLMLSARTGVLQVQFRLAEFCPTGQIRMVPRADDISRQDDSSGRGVVTRREQNAIATVFDLSQNA